MGNGDAAAGEADTAVVESGIGDNSPSKEVKAGDERASQPQSDDGDTGDEDYVDDEHRELQRGSSVGSSDSEAAAIAKYVGNG